MTTNSSLEAVEIIRALSDVPAGSGPIDAGEELINPAIVMHCGGVTFEGTSGWRIWVRFIRTRRRIDDLELIDRVVSIDGDRIRLDGRWRGRREGRLVESEPCSAWYRVEDSTVVEVWTSPSNYTFIVGWPCRDGIGWYLTCAYAGVWSRLVMPRRDWTSHDDAIRARPPDQSR